MNSSRILRGGPDACDAQRALRFVEKAQDQTNRGRDGLQSLGVGHVFSSEHEVPGAHRVMRAADRMTRPAADATASSRCELVTSFLPSTSTLRRSCAWQTYRRRGAHVERLAHHEAGHIALMEWLGLTGLKAEVSSTSGLAHWPPGVFESLPPPEPDPTGIWRATAASVYHAGVMAEMLHEGAAWSGPIWYADQTDYLRADDMLFATFGRHASGAHAFAQKVALNVLADRWDRVQEVAAHLVVHGAWHSEPVTSSLYCETQGA